MEPRTESYPPAPWHLRGDGWAGLFRAERAPEPPLGWTQLGRELVLSLNRYCAPLTYDELAVGVPVHRGARAALWVPKLWVNHPASVAGGRAIWSLDKGLGEFTWGEGWVAVREAGRPIAALRFGASLPHLPMPLVLPSLSFDGAVAQLALARGVALGAPCRLEVESWSLDALRPAYRAQVAVELRGFRMRFPAPKRLERAAPSRRHAHA